MHYRGLHIVVINPHNGEIQAKRVFDTYKSCEAFENYIKEKSIPDGSIVVAACKDDMATCMSWDCYEWFL